MMVITAFYLYLITRMIEMIKNHVIIGEEALNNFKNKEGDLFISREILSSLKNFSETNDKSETIGRIRRNEKRYNKEFLPEHIPIIEMFRGKSTDNPTMHKDNSDKMSYYNTTLDFHTHPKNTDTHLPSQQDCSSFIPQKNNAGKTFHAILSNGEMSLCDLSNIERDELNKCRNINNPCGCLKEKGMKIYNIDGKQDLLLKRVFKK